MFRGETSVEINENLDKVYEISRKDMVKIISKLRPEVAVLEEKDDYILMRISDYVSGKKFTWDLKTSYDDNKKTITHIQTEGTIKGLVAIWYFKEISEDSTQILCVHEFIFKNVPIFRNFISRLIYKLQIKPVVDELFDMIKKEAERNA